MPEVIHDFCWLPAFIKTFMQSLVNESKMVIMVLGNIASNLLGASPTTKTKKTCFYNPSWCHNWKLGHHPTMGGCPPSNAILHVKKHYPILLALKWKVGCFQKAKTAFWFLSQRICYSIDLNRQPVALISNITLIPPSIQVQSSNGTISL